MLRQTLMVVVVSLILVLSSAFTGPDRRPPPGLERWLCNKPVLVASIAPLVLAPLTARVASVDAPGVSPVVVPPRPKLKGALGFSTKPYETCNRQQALSNGN